MHQIKEIMTRKIMSTPDILELCFLFVHDTIRQSHECNTCHSGNFLHLLAVVPSYFRCWCPPPGCTTLGGSEVGVSETLVMDSLWCALPRAARSGRQYWGLCLWCFCQLQVMANHHCQSIHTHQQLFHAHCVWDGSAPTPSVRMHLRMSQCSWLFVCLLHCIRPQYYRSVEMGSIGKNTKVTLQHNSFLLSDFLPFQSRGPGALGLTWAAAVSRVRGSGVQTLCGRQGPSCWGWTARKPDPIPTAQQEDDLCGYKVRLESCCAFSCACLL